MSMEFQIIANESQRGQYRATCHLKVKGYNNLNSDMWTLNPITTNNQKNGNQINCTDKLTALCSMRH